MGPCPVRAEILVPENKTLEIVCRAGGFARETRVMRLSESQLRDGLVLTFSLVPDTPEAVSDPSSGVPPPAR